MVKQRQRGIVTTFRIPSNDQLDKTTIEIGGPIANTHVYLLDEQRRLVQVGAVGEIYVGGPTLGRGYLNRPESEKFIPNPFSNDSGDRLYKTGDLARYRPDGSTEFVGRLDDQVKIRGMRIELGDVEAALIGCPGIKEAAVVPGEDESNNRRLIAYVVSKSGEVSTTSALRSFLSAKLPEYMIPSAFVVLDALPRLPSGKLDRLALPAPDYVRPELDRPHVAPRTSLQLQLLNIWQTVLAVGGIGITDNFFDLGGNSLSAMYLLNHVNKVFGKGLSVASLYMAPTVEEFASLMEHQRQPVTTTSLLTHKTSNVPAVQEPSYLVELQRGEGQTAIFCFMFSGGFKGEFATFAGMAPLIGRRYTFYGVIARGTDGKLNSHGSVEEMAAAYIQQIKTAQPQGPYFLIGECFSAPVAYETARQLLNQGDRVAMLAFLDARVPGTTMNRILGSRITARVRYTQAILSETSIYIRYRIIRDEVEVTRKTHGGKGWLRHLFMRIGKTITKKTLRQPVLPLDKTQSSGTSATMSGSDERKSKQLHRAAKNYGLAVRRYECRPYAGKITILASTEFLDSNPTMGWRHVRDLQIHEIPGKTRNVFPREQADGGRLSEGDHREKPSRKRNAPDKLTRSTVRESCAALLSSGTFRPCDA